MGARERGNESTGLFSGLWSTIAREEFISSSFLTRVAHTGKVVSKVIRAAVERDPVASAVRWQPQLPVN